MGQQGVLSSVCGGGGVADGVDGGLVLRAVAGAGADESGVVARGAPCSHVQDGGGRCSRGGCAAMGVDCETLLQPSSHVRWCLA
jgi:hypothetical protein